MRKTFPALCALAALSGLAFAELPDADKAIDRLGATLRDMRDVSCDVEVHTGDKQASGAIVLQYAHEKQNGVEKVVRKYIVATKSNTADGMALVKQVNDGKYLWVERKIVETGEVKVRRRRIDPEGPVPGGFGIDWRKQMDSWRKKYDFKTLREDTFDGEKVVVVEGTRRADAEPPPAGVDITQPDRFVLSIAARDDFVRKADFYVKVAVKQPDGGPPVREVLLVSVRFLHVKLNEGLKTDAFDYLIPQGAEFTDVK